MDPLTVPDEQVLRVVGLEETRRGQLQEPVHTEPVVSDPEEPIGAERVGDDECSLLRPPERDLPPAGPSA